MALVLMALVGAAAGMWVGRWWVLTIPLAVGLVVLALAVADLGVKPDNPLLFVCAVLELGLAAGVAARTYVTRKLARKS